MAASLDGFVARKDGSVDWMETSDEFVGGETMDQGFVEAFLETIDCSIIDRDIGLHLTEVKAYESGIWNFVMRYESHYRATEKPLHRTETCSGRHAQSAANTQDDVKGGAGGRRGSSG